MIMSKINQRFYISKGNVYLQLLYLLSVGFNFSLEFILLKLSIMLDICLRLKKYFIIIDIKDIDLRDIKKITNL